MVVNLGKGPALIVVDMQNGYLREGGFLDKIGLDYKANFAVVDPIVRLLSAARAAGIEIFFTRYCLNSDYSDAGLIMQLFPEIRRVRGMVRGTWDTDILDLLRPEEGEQVIDKTRYSAFYGTDLEEQLRGNGVDTVIVCGVTTNICVESTIRDAFFRDFRVLVPSDATAAVTPELHGSALRNIDFGFGNVTTVAEIEKALQDF